MFQGSCLWLREQRWPAGKFQQPQPMVYTECFFTHLLYQPEFQEEWLGPCLSSHCKIFLHILLTCYWELRARKQGVWSWLRTFQFWHLLLDVLEPGSPSKTIYTASWVLYAGYLSSKYLMDSEQTEGRNVEGNVPRGWRTNWVLLEGDLEPRIRQRHLSG